VVAILKDAVHSSCIYLAHCLPRPLKHTIIVLCRWVVSNTCQTETTSTFLYAIFISGMTATPGDVNIIAIEKVYPDNIGLAVGILFLCVLETK